MLNLLIKNYGTILIFIIILSFLASYIFYRFNGKSLSPIKKWTLIALRGAVFSLIAFLLFNPVIESINQVDIKKKLVVLVDNSTSMKTSDFDFSKTQQALNTIKTKLQDDVDVVEYAFDKDLSNLDTYSGQGKYSNISGSLKAIQNQFESSEIQGAILISDGIYNTSYHPKWINPKVDFPIYTVGYGDTIQYPDLGVDHIQHNAVSYLGNEFPVEISLSTKAWKEKPVQLIIRDHSGKKVHEENWNTPAQSDFKILRTKLTSKKIGINTYTVQVVSQESEKNTKNNLEKFSIDVLDVKNKILLLASEVHPDHHAIHQSIKSNIDYEVEFKQLDKKAIDLKPYDCVIYLGYQKETQSYLQETLKNNQAFILKVNQKTDLKGLQKAFPKVFHLNKKVLDWDLALNTVNKNFKGFTVSKSVKEFLKNSPPLHVPFTNLESQNPSKHILLQNILGTTNKKGIISVGDLNKTRFGLIQGEGFWKWRMNDFKTNTSFESFDSFFQSIVRLINVQKDKRLFYVDFPSTLNQDEEELIDVKIYNESYQQITEDELQLKVKHNEGLEFTFPFSTLNDFYQSKVLLATTGHYTYEVINLSKSNKRMGFGEFDVVENTLESQNEVANFEVLRYLANETNGKFVTGDQLDDLSQILTSKPIEKKVYSQKRTKGLISKTWILILILILGLLEWFLRRKFTLQ